MKVNSTILEKLKYHANDIYSVQGNLHLASPKSPDLANFITQLGLSAHQVRLLTIDRVRACSHLS